jgi:23S rRNA (uridine2552-2'-O)-methyltransferase
VKHSKHTSKRSKSSQRWLKEHFSDAYVKRAQKEGVRARSFYKLEEINQRYQIIKQGMIVVDLGAAPGGWSEACVKLVGSKGKVYALDILPINPIPGVDFIQGDFSDNDVVTSLLHSIGEHSVDVVISDMAPNMSGIIDVDIPRSMNLVESAFSFAILALKNKGSFLTKIFQGEGFDSFLKLLRSHFKEVISIKPKASRARSRELYLLARGFVVK